MEEIKNPKYVVGYFGHDYKNIYNELVARDDIEVLNLRENMEGLEKNRISSFVCEMDDFKEDNSTDKNYLYNLISENQNKGIPIIGIQRNDTTGSDIMGFNNFVGEIDNNSNNWYKTPTIKCNIDVSSDGKVIRDYSKIKNAITPNQVLTGNDYSKVMLEIKQTVNELKNSYMNNFYSKIKSTIKKNMNKDKDEMKKLISMSIVSTISEMAIKVGKEVENQIGKQDKYTEGHVNSTSAIANMLAVEISKNEKIMSMYIKEKNPKEKKSYSELNEEEKQEYKIMFFNDVSASGLLHDAGKLAIAMNRVPEKDEKGNIIGYYNLLDLPRKLTNEEFAIIQTHTDIGYNILMEVAENVESTLDKKLKINLKDSLKQIGEGILYHHERVDGKGYHNIPNERFPVVAKIIQTADIYDALISERSYKFAWPDDFARNEMRRQEGKQCDKIYLDALDTVMKDVRKSTKKKKEFTTAIGRDTIIWNIRDIKDKEKLEALKQIAIKNDARMGKSVKKK